MALIIERMLIFMCQMLQLKKHITGLTLVAIALCCYTKSNAQVHGPYDTMRVYAYITPEGDTIPMSYLPYVLVTGKLTPQWKKHWAEWTRLRNAVYVTYPYAKAASRIMNEINLKLVNVKDKKKRKSIIHSREKELRKEFTDKLTNLSIYQGKVLMKLINRETGNNCYEIVEEYKGFITAAVYQTVAFVFGTSLKQAYNANGPDRDMEMIVREVEKMYGYTRG
jgi:hypothetical protein